MSDKVFTHHEPGYRWCLHCERGYEATEAQWKSGLASCPYKGCGGSMLGDSFEWERIATLNGYPDKPVQGTRYPQYGHPS